MSHQQGLGTDPGRKISVHIIVLGMDSQENSLCKIPFDEDIGPRSDQKMYIVGQLLKLRKKFFLCLFSLRAFV